MVTKLGTKYFTDMRITHTEYDGQGISNDTIMRCHDQCARKVPK